jgi:hypothetical protein
VEKNRIEERRLMAVMKTMGLAIKKLDRCNAGSFSDIEELMCIKAIIENAQHDLDIFYCHRYGENIDEDCVLREVLMSAMSIASRKQLEAIENILTEEGK